jgi:hypothetical protein
VASLMSAFDLISDSTHVAPTSANDPKWTTQKKTRSELEHTGP